MDEISCQNICRSSDGVKYGGIIPSSATFHIASSQSDLTDNEKILKCFKSDSLESKQFLSDLTVQSELFTKDMDTAIYRGSEFNRTFSGRDQPVEEPWLLQSSLRSHNPAQSSSSICLTDEDGIQQHHNSDSLETKSLNQSILEVQPCSKCVDTVSSFDKKYNYHRNFFEPVEEPWLFESCHFLGSNAKVDSKESFEDQATQPKVYDQHHQVTEKLLPEEVNNAIAQEDFISTDILINSSVCTMQRIAVLEDGKLVELLLEPVKNNVQCGSVYLGVVSKLVPHMTGAFVNIGSSKPSLMDIKHNREPFIFPPFISMPEDQPGCDETQNNSRDIEKEDEIEEGEIDDDSVRYLHDEYTEHDIEDDYDIQEIVKENVNGSLPGHGEAKTVVDGCSDQVDGGMHNVEGCSDNSMHNVESCSDNSLPSQLQDKLIDFKKDKNRWAQVQKGTKIIVQVVKEGLGTKGPTLTAYPELRSRFWILITRRKIIGISKKICGVERTRLRLIAKKLQPRGFGLTVRTVAAGHSPDELQKDLEGLLSTWKDITEHAKSAALAADEGMEGAIPVMLHRATGQTLSVVQDYFNNKVKSMVIDSPRTYHEVTNYLQEIAPDLCDRVKLYKKRIPLFNEYNIEEEMNNILCKRVPLANGGYLVIEQTEALVSVDVNGGQCMLGQGTSQEKAILDVNLAAAKQIARELRLRDIGGIIVVDFIDMLDDANKRLIYEEVKKAVEKDRSTVTVSELSRHGLMEIIRKRVRPSVTFMISEPCISCHATGRVEALETSFSKIEHEICRLLAMMNQKATPENPKSWPRFILRVDRYMCSYLTSGKRTRLAILSSSLKVWILLKVARGFTRGAFEVKPLTDDKDNNGQHQGVVSMLQRSEGRSHTRSRKVTVFPVKTWKTGRK
ncbi:Ribonuclease E/G-like protein [Actinidia chinensis var. chinensis]|uniref:Ribonuclease E/G-like protein n=1 Tax=Actinidia chinensis var. chinensis TaxID=1590841 RepID=A0A2R6RJ24_ACTCC|nr:Ribonuclease E/G-like protein [Actinidia chinensis var. chinensis]